MTTIRTARRAILGPLTLGAALALAGCADTGGLRPLATLLAPTTVGAQLTPMDWPDSAWWTRFDDAQLNRLIEQALAGNPSLKVAEARRAKAAAVAAVAESALLPALNADVDSTRRRFSEKGEVPPPYAGTVQTLSHARLNGSWELDFFGRNRAALDAALGNARAAEADAQAARTLLASDVARTYYRLAGLLEQRDILQATQEERQQFFELVAERVHAGLDTRVELRQAEGTVPEIRRELAALDNDIGQTRHALAALTGQGPEAADTLAPALAAAPVQALPERLPADLIGRRADLVAARWRVEAALRDTDAARAAFYPNINLTAMVGYSSFGISNWFESGSHETGLGAAVHLPIFDAGRLRANLRGSVADADAVVENYNATLLLAVREVADQLTLQRALARQSAEQRAALNAAEGAYALATQRYRAGLTPYLTVLTAEANVLAQRRVAADLKAREIDANLQLIRVLGGGYAAA